jgi:hypothetical protein
MLLIFQAFPAEAEAVVEHKLMLLAGSDRWTFETRRRKRYDPWASIDRFVRISLNGKTMWQEPAGLERPRRLPYGFFFRFSKVDIQAPWPVVAIRGHSGIGFHQDTKLFAIANRHLIFLGVPPSPNANGPVNYRGRSNLWLFDDYNVYQHKSASLAGPPLRYMLYRVDLHGLRRVRSWIAPSGMRVEDTIKLNDW